MIEETRYARKDMTIGIDLRGALCEYSQATDAQAVGRFTLA
jgi:hypothetical protein